MYMWAAKDTIYSIAASIEKNLKLHFNLDQESHKKNDLTLISKYIKDKNWMVTTLLRNKLFFNPEIQAGDSVLFTVKEGMQEKTIKGTMIQVCCTQRKNSKS